MVSRIGLCLVVSIMFAHVSRGQDTGGMGPVDLPTCYSEVTEKTCAQIAISLISDWHEPIRIGCGECYPDGNNSYKCPVQNHYAIYPNEGNTTYQWVIPVRDGMRKSFEERPEVKCGNIDKCTGCKRDPEDNKRYCGALFDKDWKINPRKLAGEQCDPIT